MTLDVVPVAGVIGAELRGVDVSGPLGGEEILGIRRALLDWKVVFFRDQTMGPAEQVAFGRRFGEVTPAHPTLPSLDGHPEVLLLSAEAYGLDPGRRPPIENRWHTDVTFLPRPPMATILRGVTVPAHGGDTAWTNLVAAYESLSAPVRELVDGLHAVHRNELHLERSHPGAEGLRDKFTQTAYEAVHPVVRVHPETGERALFVNPQFTSHIVGVSNRESRKLLELLFETLTDPRFTVRFHWAPGSVAFWDNRATAHLASFDDVGAEVRTMHRITLAGDEPVGVGGAATQVSA